MRILIAEDDPLLAEGLVSALRTSASVVDLVEDGRAAQMALQAHAFDLIILDIGLPGLSGFDLLAWARARRLTTPVLILTALDDVQSRVKGLDLGADDYLSKPFELSELEARVRALTRRSRGHADNLIRIGRLTVNTAGRSASVDDEVLDLSAREFALLEILASRVGRVVGKEQIIDLLCQWDAEVSANAVEVYVHRLRKKLETGGVTLSTLRGMGYCLNRPEHHVRKPESHERKAD